MPFKLIVRLVSQGSEIETFERSYDQELVRIGRREFNDLQLRDPQRLISGAHAEIRQVDRQWKVVDVGSKNGTRLNGEAIASGREYLLNQKDQMGIGDFLIEFCPEAVQEAAPLTPETGEDEAPGSEVADKASKLISELSAIYAAHAGEERARRAAAMVESLRKGLEGLDDVGRQELLFRVESHFPEPGYLEEQLLRERLTPKSALPSEKEIRQAAYQGLLHVARKYFDPEGLPKTKETTEQFIGRLDHVLEMMVDYLSNAVKGRRQFEEEFDVEATRIFSWKPNPIKLAEGKKEIGAYLLDWRKKEGGEKVACELEEVFNDLALHQVGLMAGFRECLKGLMERLDPRSMEAEVDSKPVKLGPLKIPRRFLPFGKKAAWDHFKKTHKELSEEEVKTFETILGPHFAKGYLSVQKKKKSP